MSNLLKSTKFTLTPHPDDPMFLPGPPDRRLHIIARISTGLREFIAIQDFKNPMDVWLNEVTFGSVDEIEDDDLFHDLYAFLCEKKVLTVDAE